MESKIERVICAQTSGAKDVVGDLHLTCPTADCAVTGVVVKLNTSGDWMGQLMLDDVTCPECGKLLMPHEFVPA